MTGNTNNSILKIGEGDRQSYAISPPMFLVNNDNENKYRDNNWRHSKMLQSYNRSGIRIISRLKLKPKHFVNLIKEIQIKSMISSRKSRYLSSQCLNPCKCYNEVNQLKIILWKSRNQRIKLNEPLNARINKCTYGPKYDHKKSSSRYR